MDQQPPRPEETGWRAFILRDRCALLAGALLALFLVGGFDDERSYPGLVASVVYTLVVAIAIFAVSAYGIWRWIGGALGSLALLYLWVGEMLQQGAMQNSLQYMGQIFLIYMSVRVIMLIWREREPESNRMYAAICGYVCIGVLFAHGYIIAESLRPGGIAGTGTGLSGSLTRRDLYYFSFVTQTTLGYGDMTPRTPEIRTVATLQAITGVLYVATTIASLVARRDAKRN